METKDIKRFGKIIRGYIHCHRDTETKKLIPNADSWLSEKMGKSMRTIGEYLYNPSLMNLGSCALMKQVLRENIIGDDNIDFIVKLIDLVPEK